MNAAIDSDDGNPRLCSCAHRALEEWLLRLTKEIRRGQRRKEIRETVVPRDVAALLIATLEGALMISRLQNQSDALQTCQTHLWSFLESEVRIAAVT